MDLKIFPQKLRGSVKIIPSKSLAHRFLICAAFADKPTELVCPHYSADIEATILCLQALGAQISHNDGSFYIVPAKATPTKATLPCGESGTTLRFLLPISAALGVDATFCLEGRLNQRPLEPLCKELERMGCRVSAPNARTLCCTGKLQAGNYQIDGSLSSQFVSGLMLALSILNQKSSLRIVGSPASRPYISLTAHVLSIFGIHNNAYGKNPLLSPGKCVVEGDWSNGAFFYAANSLGCQIAIGGLDPDSVQGDRSVVEIISALEQKFLTVSCKDIPDLLPVLSVVSAAHHGAVFTDVARLRFKESDRISAVCSMLKSLGIHFEASDDSLRVYPGQFRGGIIDCFADHRIAMSAAIAATAASGPLTLLGAECVAKSYPQFWEEYSQLGGNYEQYLR